MDANWLYMNLGTLAKTGAAAALLIIGILSLIRKSKKRKLEKTLSKKL